MFSRLLRSLSRRSLFLLSSQPHRRHAVAFVGATMSGIGGLALTHYAHASDQRITAEDMFDRVTVREQRFMDFASLEYKGDLFMTPADFLDSVTLERARRHDSTGAPCRRQLAERDTRDYLDRTPALSKGSSHLFRTIGGKGMISYSEYLFLLCILTKPKSGFEIAFHMFDMDGNQRVDRAEFIVIEHMMASRTKKETARVKEERRDAEQEGEELEVTTDLPNVQDTTLLRHLFGQRGRGELSFDAFFTFYNNLQREVLELEFHEFTRGANTMTELDFAKVLLRYALVHTDDYHAYLARTTERIAGKEQGITLNDFIDFCQFLNNLDDFAIAMKLHTFAQQPVTQQEFSRAVYVSTGRRLREHVVDTVFQIFDADGDGCLSYNEFIALMKDRLHRGLKRHGKKVEGYKAFKACVRNQVRKY